MFDPDFDPLELLDVATQNIDLLINAVNEQATFLKELSKQHNALAQQNLAMSVMLKEVTKKIQESD